MYFSARAEGRISYGHLGRTNSCYYYMFAQIVVRVIDVNDNYPIASVSTLEGATSGSVSTETSASVPENSDVGSFVAHISVDDADTGPAGQVSSHQRWNRVSDTDPRPDPTRDASDP